MTTVLHSILPGMDGGGSGQKGFFRMSSTVDSTEMASTSLKKLLRNSTQKLASNLCPEVLKEITSILKFTLMAVAEVRWVE